VLFNFISGNIIISFIKSLIRFYALSGNAEEACKSACIGKR